MELHEFNLSMLERRSMIAAAVQNLVSANVLKTDEAQEAIERLDRLDARDLIACWTESVAHVIVRGVVPRRWFYPVDLRRVSLN